MDVNQLRSDLETLFSEYPKVYFSVHNSDGFCYTEIVYSCSIPDSVKQNLVTLLREYNFKFYSLNVRNKLTSASKHHFSRNEMDMAICYKPKIWEESTWSGLHF